METTGREEEWDCIGTARSSDSRLVAYCLYGQRREDHDWGGKSDERLAAELHL